MRVLHVPYCYYPDAVGGTEVYVDALAREQRKLGLEPAIAAPGFAGEYSHAGCRVFRFATGGAMPLDEFYGDGDKAAAQNFVPILERFRPDVLHLHARSQAVSVLLVRAAKSRGIPVVFTYHTPTVTCARGTMMRWGRQACAGEMHPRRCASCMLHGRGLPIPLATAVAQLPYAIGRSADSAGLTGRAVTALRIAELVRMRGDAVSRLLDEVDHICAVCEWVREVLMVNGVPRERITLTRQAVPWPIPAEAAPDAAPCGELRLVFLGRADERKGLHTALAAIRSLQGCNVRLDIFAITQSEGGRAVIENLKRQNAGDTRIRFRPPIDSQNVIAELRRHDALLVPSEWLETGPLVVYEAFAAGIPVLGSRLGGIAELVRDAVNGILIEPGSVEKWAAAIRRLVDEPGLLRSLKSAPKPIRTAEDLARDSVAVYEHVFRQHVSAKAL